jgi:hypothetical protein
MFSDIFYRLVLDKLGKRVAEFELIFPIPEEQDDSTNNERDIEVENVVISDAIYLNSPWYQEAMKIYVKVEAKIRQDVRTGELNHLYNPDFADTFVQHTLTYAPLYMKFFSSCGRINDPNWRRPNNAHVERYHRWAKDHLKAVHNAAPTLVNYVKHIRNKLLLDCKQVLLKVPNSSGIFRSRKMPTGMGNPNNTGQWKGKIQKETLFFDPGHAARTAQQIKEDLGLNPDHQIVMQTDLVESVDYLNFAAFYRACMSEFDEYDDSDDSSDPDYYMDYDGDTDSDFFADDN